MSQTASAHPVETIEVDASRVACDGDAGASSHPRVFLEIGEKTSIACPYCGRLYVLKEGASAGGH